ncbi:MAG: hypothetical protein SX243_01850 [Acidobacteriota bacterium]|nr:hypothetical protein [Acidobacteriota bacterium]
MKLRWQDWLAGLMILAAVGLLIATGVKRLNRPQLPPVDLAQSTPVEPETILSAENFTFEGPPPETSGDRLLALFVVTAKVCDPCISEMSDYLAMLDDLDLAGVPLEPVALVFEHDEALARRFLGTSALPLAGAYGYPGGLVQLLGKHPKGIVLQQLVFIDTHTDTLFYRTLLPSSITPIEHKQEILGRMVEAFHRQRTETLVNL